MCARRDQGVCEQRCLHLVRAGALLAMCLPVLAHVQTDAATMYPATALAEVVNCVPSGGPFCWPGCNCVAAEAELQFNTLGQLAPVQARFAPTEVLQQQATRRKLADTYRSRIHHVLAAIGCKGKLRNETLNQSRTKNQRKTSKKLYL